MIDYYPKYNFFRENANSIFPDINNNDLHIYIDVKNASRSVFYENFITETYDFMMQNGKFDISPFYSYVAFILRIIPFYKQLGFRNVKLFFFMDHGKSIYHKSIHKGYKESRDISAFNLDTRITENFYTCLNTNYKISEKILNVFENVYFIRLFNLESDFVPYYLIYNKFKERKDIYHLIFSTDKDMLQCLTHNPKVYQYVKISRKDHKLILSDFIINYYIKKDEPSYEYLKEYIVVLMSLIGDTGDDVPGIKGIGPSTGLKIIKYFYDNNITVEAYEQNIYNKKPFDLPDDIKLRKLIEKVNDNLNILRNSYRLISYKALLEYIDIKSGKLEDKYNFNYSLNKEARINLDKIDELLERPKMNLDYESAVKLLLEISKNACCKKSTFTYEELQNYFQK